MQHPFIHTLVADCAAPPPAGVMKQWTASVLDSNIPPLAAVQDSCMEAEKQADSLQGVSAGGGQGGGLWRQCSQRDEWERSDEDGNIFEVIVWECAASSVLSCGFCHFDAMSTETLITALSVLFTTQCNRLICSRIGWRRSFSAERVWIQRVPTPSHTLCPGNTGVPNTNWKQQLEILQQNQIIAVIRL